MSKYVEVKGKSRERKSLDNVSIHGAEGGGWIVRRNYGKNQRPDEEHFEDSKQMLAHVGKHTGAEEEPEDREKD